MYIQSLAKENTRHIDTSTTLFNVSIIQYKDTNVNFHIITNYRTILQYFQDNNRIFCASL